MLFSCDVLLRESAKRDREDRVNDSSGVKTLTPASSRYCGINIRALLAPPSPQQEDPSLTAVFRHKPSIFGIAHLHPTGL